MRLSTVATVAYSLASSLVSDTGMLFRFETELAVVVVGRLLTVLYLSTKENCIRIQFTSQSPLEVLLALWRCIDDNLLVGGWRLVAWSRSFNAHVLHSRCLFVIR